MDESVYFDWNRITDTQITPNGEWILYQLVPGYGDKILVVYNSKSKKEIRMERAEDPTFDKSGQYVYFLRTPAKEFVKEQKRLKTKKEDMPSDTLIVYNLITRSETVFPNISSYKIPKEYGGTIAAKIKGKDNSKKGNNKKQKDEKIIYYQPDSDILDTLHNVIQFTFADENSSLIYSVKSDSISTGGIFIKNENGIDSTFIVDSKIYQLAINKNGTQAAFILDTDTTDVLYRPYQLYHWKKNSDTVTEIINSDSPSLPKKWDLSHEKKPSFSDDGTRLFFGVTPQRLLQDTSKLDEEIVNVEIWHYKEAKLYTQQELDQEDDEIKSYDAVYFTQSNAVHLLQDESFPSLRMDLKREAEFALIYTDTPYKTHETWQGYAENDVYKVNIQTGEKIKIAEAIHARPSISPAGNYIFWYDRKDATWVAHNTANNTTVTFADDSISTFYDELHDAPSDPRPYGIEGWTTDEKFVIVNDRYDLWLIDPNNIIKPQRLTQGREYKTKYTYIQLDEEEHFINLDESLLLKIFDEKDKSSGYGIYDYQNRKVEQKIKADCQFTTNVIKAEKNDNIIYTKQSFKTFPNLLLDNLSFTKQQQITNANPQQEDYAWGDNEIFSWTAFDGQKLDGILVLPPGFDPEKKYPLLVNFYERSTNGLHRHKPPSAGRSTINYSFYSNRGYIIFNPDVPYTVGEPGESCYNSVISGISALIAEGFIDKNKIGVQGHSWGGYQVAHLVTKTDIFACAESGAPLVNMISAYGGIRWGTGRSRQFQYEKTQSRLGATLWESPELYIKNSPLFNADKINTPVLIMHNDADGHVPWHLGIEFFMALRRLQKPSWLLNYNGEPHWPLKWQNRLDFNIRMQQYFDHYLKDAPMPDWMKSGIPAIEKGIRSGYEFSDRQ
jgi:dipeptidyl aminopeptidase/acylaminoacyl peptidase